MTHRPFDYIQDVSDDESGPTRPLLRHRASRLVRWLWTELTSMRTALLLLLLLFPLSPLFLLLPLLLLLLLLIIKLRIIYTTYRTYIIFPYASPQP